MDEQSLQQLHSKILSYELRLNMKSTLIKLASQRSGANSSLSEVNRIMNNNTQIVGLFTGLLNHIIELLTLQTSVPEQHQKQVHAGPESKHRTIMNAFRQLRRMRFSSTSSPPRVANGP